MSRLFIFSIGLLMFGGCGLDLGYLLPALQGQCHIIHNTITMDDALDSPTLSAEQKRKLELIQSARDFAGSTIGLEIGNNFTTFYDGGDQPVAFNLSASRADALEPYEWSFPFFGSFPYLGYFDRERMEQRREQLKLEGYDVYVYELDAYNLGSFVPVNPVLSPMLERDDSSLVETVIHECLHSTVYRNNDTPFNESLATFVGRQGAIEYFTARYGADSAETLTALARFADRDRYTNFMLELVTELEEFYGGPLTSAEKIEQREALFSAARMRFHEEVQPLMNEPERYEQAGEFPTNNAFLLGFARYHQDLTIFEAVYLSTDQHWPTALAVFADAAASVDDPYQYLADYLAALQPVD